MVNAYRKALEKLYRDRCTIIHRVKITDSDSKLTDFAEEPLLKDQPCKLSFSSLATAEGDRAAAVSQSVKLFLSPDVHIPAGCKVIITRTNALKHQFVYCSSGEPGIFTDHQEIELKLFRGWA